MVFSKKKRNIIRFFKCLDIELKQPIYIEGNPTRKLKLIHRDLGICSKLIKLIGDSPKRQEILNKQEILEQKYQKCKKHLKYSNSQYISRFL